MCGENVVYTSSISVKMGSPPHVRGKRISEGKVQKVYGITPACAGKTMGGSM